MAALPDHDVLIAGAGLAGLTMALSLSGQGLSIGLISPAPLSTDRSDPFGTARTTAVLDGPLALFETLAIWPEVAPFSAPLEQMHLRDAGTGRHLKFVAKDIGLSAFGQNIPNALLSAVLAARLEAASDVIVHTGRTVETADFGTRTAQVRLDDGTRLSARLLIAADGARSALRQAAKIPAEQEPFDQFALTFILEHSADHLNTSTEFHRPAGPLTVVPLPGCEHSDSHRSSIVYVCRKQDGITKYHWPREQLEKALSAELNGLLGDIRIAAGPGAFPVNALHATNLTAPRCALIAEAAHALPPIGAQGLNCSLLDVAWLRHHVLTGHRRGQDIGTIPVLNAYSHSRAADISRRFQGVMTLNRFVSDRSPLLQKLRRTATDLFASSAAARDEIMALAMITRDLMPPGLNGSLLQDVCPPDTGSPSQTAEAAEPKDAA